MKQIRTLLISSIAVITATLTTSCEKEYITEEYITKEYYGSQVHTREYVIKKADWQVGDFDDGRIYLYAECDNPDITENVMNNGAVLGYFWLTYNPKENFSSWNLMPYVYPYITVNDKDEQIIRGENFRIEYETGIVTFVVEDLNGVQPDEMGDETIFKVVVIENL